MKSDLVGKLLLAAPTPRAAMLRAAQRSKKKKKNFTAA